MTREEQIKAITLKVWATRFGWNEYANFDFVMIWDVLDYIDRNLFRNPSKYEWVFEIDIKAREKCITSLYNYFIWNYKKQKNQLFYKFWVFRIGKRLRWYLPLRQ